MVILYHMWIAHYATMNANVYIKLYNDYMNNAPVCM